MREQTLFIEALEIVEPAERAAFLDRACGVDLALRERVERLLGRHQPDDSFLNGPVIAADVTVEALRDPDGQGAVFGTSQEPGSTVIGPYKLLQPIGEGGMGTVYMAEQERPVRRKVALKIIKPGMDSKQVIARFEAERQALALMDHPNIARVLDAGTTEAGRPYFAMELVRGVPITRYCDERRLSPRARLELFIPVCQAVQHAHQKGIIHRDLKPSNVLIALYDDKPVPKVIDFGIAKATGPTLTERTLFTEFGQVVGTLEYMSPEQAGLNQLDIDTRSDIYSLGVLLYELLTGSTPLQAERMKGAAMLEVLRLIREEEPPKPSTRLSTTDEMPTVAANRGLEPKRLSGLVRGDLDWVVMKALEKDRNRRYETANGLASDVQHYLADEPVQACPPSAGYRLRKFARRYRTLLRIAGSFAVLLVLAAAVSTWQAVRATRAGWRALAERDRAAASFRMARDAVDRFFTQVSQSPDLKAHAMETFRKELLQDAEGFYERFIREQHDAAEVRHDLGLAHLRLATIRRELGDFPAAEASAGKAVAVLGELARARPDVVEYRRDLGAAYATLAAVYFDTARRDQADSAYGRALEIQEGQAHAHPDATEYRLALAKTYNAAGLVDSRSERPERAAARYQRALDTLGTLVRDHATVPEYRALMAATHMNMGQLDLTRGRNAEAETALKEAIRLYEGLVIGRLGPVAEHSQSLARCEAVLGHVYYARGEVEKAEESQQRALKRFETLAQEHPDVQEYAYSVGRCLFEMAMTADRASDPDVALARYDRAIESLEGARARGYLIADDAIVGARINRAAALAGRGEHARAIDEAEALARKGDLQSGNLYDLACLFSRAAAAAHRDVELSPADRTRLEAAYADRAMALLHRTVSRGWHHTRVIKDDPDLEPIRTRDDFRKLLTDLERTDPE